MRFELNSILPKSLKLDFFCWNSIFLAILRKFYISWWILEKQLSGVTLFMPYFVNKMFGKRQKSTVTKKPDFSKCDLFRLIQIPSNTCLVIKYFFDNKIKATAKMNDNIWNEAISVLWINNFSSITNQFNWNPKIEINSFWPWHVHSFFLFPVKISKLICWPLY